jgi:hypothetical protein
MSREQELDRAVRKADAARHTFMASWQDARGRFSPPRLRAEAREKANAALQDLRDQARQSVRSHPLIAGGTLVAVIGWLFRRPIAALSRRLYVKMRDEITEEER